MPDLDPLTGKDPSSLTVAQLAERLAMERALREQGERHVSDNLKMQAVEYERRLAELNHAHEIAKEAAAATVPREVYDRYVKEHEVSKQAQLAALDARIDALNEADIARRTDEKNREIREARDRINAEQRVSRQQWQIGIFVLVASLVINLVLRLLNVG